MNTGSKDLDALRETASRALIGFALVACLGRGGDRHGARRRLADADYLMSRSRRPPRFRGAPRQWTFDQLVVPSR